MNALFGPFMVGDAKFGKKVAPYVSIGFKQFPVDQCDIEVELLDRRDRMTATRVVAGGVLLGPVGMILGGMAKKDVTKGRMILRVNGDRVQVYEFKAADLDKAEQFVEALTKWQRTAASTPVPPPASPARWAPDPSGRHEQRWWDGIRWTEHVLDAGAQGLDPLP